MFVRRMIDVMTDEVERFRILKRFGFYDRMSDFDFIKLSYGMSMGYEPNLTNPQTFNEKLQWLKLNDRRPEYSAMVDKYEAKKYVSKLVGEEYIIPTLGVWETFDDIDFGCLPNQFVLKCTHDSGGLIICRNKEIFNKKNAKKILVHSLKRNYYLRGCREWPYKNVKPRIIAEQYMQDGQNRELTDYKFYCFNGTPQYLYVSTGMENHATARMGFLDLNWNKMDFFRNDYKPLEVIPPRPEKFGDMIELAKKLSDGIPFLRVDLYVINGKIYFGELTFSPCGGMMPFNPPEADAEVGKLLKLPTNA